MAEIDEFIEGLKLIPLKIRQEAVLKLGGGNFIIKIKRGEDFLAILYKVMPDTLRIARKKGFKATFQSLALLDKLDKLFISKNFLRKMGYVIINMKELEDLLGNLCSMIVDDEIKIKAIIENR